MNALYDTYEVLRLGHEAPSPQDSCNDNNRRCKVRIQALSPTSQSHSSVGLGGSYLVITLNDLPAPGKASASSIGPNQRTV